jgi:DNA-binding NarL/FixJ family response regulator
MIAEAMAVTVLIVDDHPSFRATARMLLEVEGYDVVGEAEDGAHAIRAAAELRPDLVLLDVNLPDIDGFAVATRLTGDDADADAPAVILISSRDSSDFGSAVTNSGARGFIPKGDLSGDAVAALLR